MMSRVRWGKLYCGPCGKSDIALNGDHGDAWFGHISLVPRPKSSPTASDVRLGRVWIRDYMYVPGELSYSFHKTTRHSILLCQNDQHCG